MQSSLSAIPSGYSTDQLAQRHVHTATTAAAALRDDAGVQQTDANGADRELREQFDKFVGGTFFRQMLGELQKSVGKPAYLHGGQAEEMFRSELNSLLADKLAESSGGGLSQGLFDLFTLQRN
ncbi:MAG: rod-binding protein [Pirellulales bacterium]|nr:rod-binding protein [Pirellulales bacterium]